MKSRLQGMALHALDSVRTVLGGVDELLLQARTKLVNERVEAVQSRLAVLDEELTARPPTGNVTPEMPERMKVERHQAALVLGVPVNRITMVRSGLRGLVLVAMFNQPDDARLTRAMPHLFELAAHIPGAASTTVVFQVRKVGLGRAELGEPVYYEMLRYQSGPTLVPFDAFSRWPGAMPVA